MTRLLPLVLAALLGSGVLSMHLAAFQQQHPDIEVRIAADNAMRDLETGQIDVAIRYSTRVHAGPGAQRLCGE